MSHQHCFQPFAPPPQSNHSDNEYLSVCLAVMSTLLGPSNLQALGQIIEFSFHRYHVLLSDFQ